MFFPSAPISFAVEITFACNNACSGCSNLWRSRHGQTLENWKALFDRIAPPQNRKRYAELIRITGGEPTLHPQFREIIEYTDTFGIPHAIFTSGRWNNPDQVIRAYLQCENFIGMLISLHGGTPSAHRSFVQADNAFDETCENITRASEAGLEVFTNTVLTGHTCEQVHEIIALSRKLGAGYAVFNRFLGGPHPLQPSEDQLRKAVRLIETLHTRGAPCRLGNCVPKCFTENSSEGANAGIEHCAVSPTGLVRPDNLTSQVFGNIFEQSIEDIWKSEQARWYRSQIPRACLKCAALSRCRGGEKSLIIEHRLETDPLMKEPITETASDTLIFDPEWRPVPCFNIREEPFGYLLTRYNWSVPVSSEAGPLIDAISGKITLREIQTRFGSEGLQFVGRLYQEGCIRFDR